jgi:hypothetical protein
MLLKLLRSTEAKEQQNSTYLFDDVFTHPP